MPVRNMELTAENTTNRLFTVTRSFHRGMFGRRNSDFCPLRGSSEHQWRAHPHCSHRFSEKPQPIVNAGFAALRREDGFV